VASRESKSFYCTEADLFFALKAAFAAGQESPYELKGQEVQRILNITKDRIDLRDNHTNYFRKYTRSAESKIERVGGLVNNIGDACPVCKGKDSLVDQKFNNQQDIFWSILCLRCGWRNSIDDVLKQIHT